MYHLLASARIAIVPTVLHNFFIGIVMVLILDVAKALRLELPIVRAFALVVVLLLARAAGEVQSTGIEIIDLDNAVYISSM